MPAWSPSYHPLGTAPARLLHLLSARLVAPGQLSTPRVGPGHWDPSHGLSCSSEPPPKPPISPPLIVQAPGLLGATKWDFGRAYCSHTSGWY